MEIVLIVLAAWLATSCAVALLIGRFLRVADRRDRATTVTASGLPTPFFVTARADAAELQETA